MFGSSDCPSSSVCSRWRVRLSNDSFKQFAEGIVRGLRGARVIEYSLCPWCPVACKWASVFNAHLPKSNVVPSIQAKNTSPECLRCVLRLLRLRCHVAVALVGVHRLQVFRRGSRWNRSAAAVPAWARRRWPACVPCGLCCCPGLGDIARISGDNSQK